MCGIAGILNLASDEPVTELAMRSMLALIRHRGPDEFGIFLDEGIGLGSARLSIVDLKNGQQPIWNEDFSLWIVFNGEIFNHEELRRDLESRGHQFTTRTDTEVLLHAYEEFGAECLPLLNGQFAFAIWNADDHALFLARDRFGIRPLFYTQQNGTLIFGSEIKAILGSSRAHAELDPVSLSQIFTFWSTLSPRTAFKNIFELPPAHWMRVDASGIHIQRWWELLYADAATTAANPSKSEIDGQAEALRSLLSDSVETRLHGEVPIAAYLSGGLDSSVIAALAMDTAPGRLNTFSIAFENAEFDESAFQQRMARFLGTKHEVVYATHEDIGRVFPEVIWHCETPILRTSPAPMFMLSSRLQELGFKVALTGEGADEMLGGYDVFKEAKIRRWWAACPKSKLRPRLLTGLYPEITGFSEAGHDFLGAFFGQGLAETDSPFYSHAIRWRNGARARRFFSDELAAEPSKWGDMLRQPDMINHSSSLELAQHLETSIFLANFLLSSQSDRMGMAHAVEGRFPFLDFRVAEFCARLPARLKLRVLTEKYLLRRMAAPLLPPEIVGRRKRPYRAPIHRAFFNSHPEFYVDEMLSARALRESGWFKATAVSQLVARLKSGARTTETDDMALAGILSTQLTHRQFVTNFEKPAPLSDHDSVKVCYGFGFRGFEPHQPVPSSNPKSAARKLSNALS